MKVLNLKIYNFDHPHLAKVLKIVRFFIEGATDQDLALVSENLSTLVQFHEKSEVRDMAIECVYLIQSRK